MKWAKVFLLAIALSLAFFAFVIWRGAMTMRQGMVDCLTWQANSLAVRFIIDDRMSHELVSEVTKFANRIEDGSQSIMSGFAVLRALYDGPLLLALLHTSQVNHIDSIEAPENFDRQLFRKVSQQFFGSISNGQVPVETWQKVRSLLMKKEICETESSIGFVIPDEVECFRKKAGLTMLHDCLAIMQGAITGESQSGAQMVPDPVNELKKILADSSI